MSPAQRAGNRRPSVAREPQVAGFETDQRRADSKRQEIQRIEPPRTRADILAENAHRLDIAQDAAAAAVANPNSTASPITNAASGGPNGRLGVAAGRRSRASTITTCCNPSPSARPMHARRQREQRDLERQRRENFAAARAKATQQCDFLGLAPREPLRRKRDCDARKQRRQQRRQTQETLAALERGAKILLRVLDGGDFGAGRQPRFRPRRERIDRRRFAGDEQAMPHAAAGSDQADRLRVGKIHDAAAARGGTRCRCPASARSRQRSRDRGRRPARSSPTSTSSATSTSWST